MIPDFVEDYVQDQICKMATKAAMDGHPLESIKWIEPKSAGDDPKGLFFVKYYEGCSGSDLPPWEK